LHPLWGEPIRPRSPRSSGGYLQILRQHLDQLRLPCGDSHRLVDAAQGVLDERLILGLAQQQADRRLIVVVLQQIVNRGELDIDAAAPIKNEP
jgi:hypothetical protein